MIMDWKTEILPVLERISDKGDDIDIMRNLFINKLNYDFSDQATLIEFPESIKKNVISIKIIAEKNEFKVLFCRIEALLKGIELQVVKRISKYHTANIIIFTNRDGDEAHFINTKYVVKEHKKTARGFRRITVGKTDRLRTAAERLSKIYADDGISALDLMVKCEEAFDVESVSKEFYKEFVEKYKELRKTVKRNNRLSNGDADHLTQEIINRLLFLYFIQKKAWLNEDYKFLYNNFKSNKKEYYKDFLVPLFKKLSIKDFEYSEFENIPFLNGGLFEFKEIEEKISIPNESFKDIFDDLLERFNFTIREDTEYEEEVAIDPEMLGKIFEELILSIESEKYKDVPDARRGSGSYYTPRFIVSFMVKQSLLNYLTNELPEIPKDKLKLLIFRPSDERDILAGIDNPKLIKEKLLNLRIVDPGVGSGAFSVDILNKLVHLIEILNKKLGKNGNRFNLRKKLIEDCIYGIDIQQRAVHLARLRLWLSLIVDLEREKIKDIPPLINLDFKIINGDSLVSKICGLKFDLKTPKPGDQKIIELIEKYKDLKDQYSEAVTENKKLVLKEKINKTKYAIAIWHLESIKNKYKQDLKSIDAQRDLFEKSEKEIKKEEVQKEEIEHKISDLEEKIEKIRTGQDIDTFNWHLDFFEVMGIKEGFDIVIANPPYGVAVNKEVYQDEFGLGSKDSYGVFAALGVNILKPGGTLCYIMSDTWQTIRTHYKLRKKLFQETEIQYLISVPMRTFKATVNTGIYLFKKNSGAILESPEKDNFIIAADFHNLDIKKGDLEAGFDMLMEEDTFDETKDGHTIFSDREMAIYAYRQKIIKKFSNLSFFIASPKLFKLMNDTTNIILGDPAVMKVDFNDKEIELVKLGDMSEVKEGINTRDNKYYIYHIKGLGKYKIADKNLILSNEKIEDLSEEDKRNGIDKYKYNNKFLLPYDKGGDSLIDVGWLPNYYSQTEFYFDWSKETVKRLKTLTVAERKNYYCEQDKINKGDELKLCAGIPNIKYIFRKGITYSRTGQYAPTFRLNSSALFDSTGSCIFTDIFDIEAVLGILCSKFIKFIFKNYIQHTVDFRLEDLKECILVNKYNLSEKIKNLVNSIIQHQKQDPKYDYMINEQVEIDKLVYEMYNLNEEDIKEVENWYFRRYPKLAEIIEKKLKEKNDVEK